MPLKGLLAAAFVCGAAAVAHADTSIEVRVLDWAGRPTDAKVTLKGPKTLSCVTKASRCTVKGPRGTYEATLEPKAGKAPAAKSIKITDARSAQVVLKVDKPDEPAAKAPATVAPVATDDDKVRRKPPGRDLQKGTKRAMSGRILDGAGRPADALVVVTRPDGTNVIGHAQSVAGRFHLHDLEPGKYSLKVYARRGGAPSTQALNVGAQAGQVVITLK